MGVRISQPPSPQRQLWRRRRQVRPICSKRTPAKRGSRKTTEAICKGNASALAIKIEARELYPLCGVRSAGQVRAEADRHEQLDRYQR